MQIVALTFGQFLPYVFIMCVFGQIVNMVVSAFTRGRL